MRTAPPDSPYEVYCQNCRVSFPVGTRSCLHCGRPIGRRSAAPATPAGPRPPATADEELLEELPGRSMAFSPMTLVWLLAAVATVVYRACT
jgi:hypothetical protein